MKGGAPWRARPTRLLAFLGAISLIGCSTAAATEPSERRPPAPRAHDAGRSCGASPLPACPLQGWMRSEAARAMKARDAVRLTQAFKTIATFAPEGYADWAPLAQRGAAEAGRGDVDAAQATCGDCHDAYRARYRAEIRERAIF